MIMFLNFYIFIFQLPQTIMFIDAAGTKEFSSNTQVIRLSVTGTSQSRPKVSDRKSFVNSMLGKYHIFKIPSTILYPVALFSFNSSTIFSEKKIASSIEIISYSILFLRYKSIFVVSPYSESKFS